MRNTIFINHQSDINTIAIPKHIPSSIKKKTLNPILPSNSNFNSYCNLSHIKDTVFLFQNPSRYPRLAPIPVAILNTRYMPFFSHTKKEHWHSPPLIIPLSKAIIGLSYVLNLLLLFFSSFNLFLLLIYLHKTPIPYIYNNYIIYYHPYISHASLLRQCKR